MVIHDLYLMGISLLPEKADPPPVVDADAMLAFPVSGKRLQTVPWGHPQIVQALGVVQDHQFGLGTALDVNGELPASFSVGNRFGIGVFVTLDHISNNSMLH